MNLWREFFIANHIIILFVYGQVFFILGLAILWQSRQHSRLDLARSLSWLGAFGLTHGLHEWGEIFIPVQAGYLSRAWIDILLLVQVCLLAFSFACLFQFGAETLAPLYPRLNWLQVIPAGLLLVWAITFLWISQVSWWGADLSIVQANVWARYMLGLPGALLAAWGLKQQTRRRIQLPEFAHIARMFQIASLALASYAIFTGLFVPPTSFFPATVINTDTTINLLGIPIQVLRSLAGLVLVVAVLRGLEIFEIEIDRRFEEMEQAQILLTERQRVSRELHDGAIQSVYTAGLMAQSIRKRMHNEDPLIARMDRVISALHHAILDLRQFIAELEPNTPGADLIEGLHKLAADPHLQSLIQVKITVDCYEGDLFPSTRATHVLAIVNEALSNVARHARAQHVWLTARHRHEQLEVTVADDGLGFSEKYVTGFGLRNMRDRARLLAGTIRLEPRLPHGTQVMLTVPWDDPR